MSELTEKLQQEKKKWFFAIEFRSDTSEKDIDDMCRLLSFVAPRFNFKWCQAVWRDKEMKKVEE